MAEELGNRVDVCPRVKENHREGVPAAVEGEILGDSGHQRPPAQLKRGFRAVFEHREHKVVRLGVTAFSEVDLRRLRDIEILLAARLLLLEDEPGEIAELLDLSPRQFLDVAFPQAGKAGEQESPLEMGVLAFRGRQLLDLLDRQVLTFGLGSLEALDGVSRIRRDHTFLICLIQTGLELIEV